MFAPDKSLQTAARRRLVVRAGVVTLIVVVAALGYHFLWRQHVKRFQVVHPGVLYRVAQPSELGIRYLIERHHVKTVLNLRLEDDHLRRGVLALGMPTGDVESHFVADLGVRSLQWQMGREACWPWVSPAQFEEFYRLFDNPANFPIAIHCVSGRHRTGTIAALFRLEYDRWPIDRVLAEMYSFSFGPPIPLQEMNLRTYTPRPQPSASEWPRLVKAWAGVYGQPAPADYAALVRQLRAAHDQAAVASALAEQLATGGTFALPLAVRLIDSPEHPATAAAISAAQQVLAQLTAATGSASPSPTTADLLSAAALVADFGPAEDQEQLLDILRTGATTHVDSTRFHAVVAGVANRYTGNRIPFLAALLDNTSMMPETGAAPVRYSEMAVAHLSAILDERLINVGSAPTTADWEAARRHAKNWLSAHPALMQASRVGQPGGPTMTR